ncbi:hypothetical protein HYT18_04635 [Candidatus Microgenomates bacterium]|nr:hypothetical protein [Candidatus Microgenomates bacterium]
MWSKGQTLVELVVVVTVIVMVIVALTFATIASLRNSQFAKNQAQATKLAQEGIERVRLGRDRNQPIISAGGLGDVTSWDGDSINPESSIWNYQIEGRCGDTSVTPPIFCYLNIDDQGVLHYLVASSTFPSSSAESIPPSPAKSLFSRAVILSDDAATFNSGKTVTVVVRWTDFSGEHESRLKTILRNTKNP